MAQIDFPASPVDTQTFASANGVTYRFASTPGIWKAIASTTDVIFSGTTPPSSPTANQLWFNSDASAGGGTLYLYYQDPAGAPQWVPASPAATPGSLIQTVYVETGAVATGTGVIPNDDTIPQITEGDQYMTLAITPKSATSKLIIEVTWVGSHNNALPVFVALFQDATANALAVVGQYLTTATGISTTSLRHAMTSGTTSATTFRVRAGAGTAVGTLTFNGQNSARTMGGVMASSIVIQEVA